MTLRQKTLNSEIVFSTVEGRLGTNEKELNEKHCERKRTLGLRGVPRGEKIVTFTLFRSSTRFSAAESLSRDSGRNVDEAL